MWCARSPVLRGEKHEEEHGWRNQRSTLVANEYVETATATYLSVPMDGIDTYAAPALLCVVCVLAL